MPRFTSLYKNNIRTLYIQYGHTRRIIDDGIVFRGNVAAIIVNVAGLNHHSCHLNMIATSHAYIIIISMDLTLLMN